MDYIKLNDGHSIPELGLGVFKAADGDETIRAVTWALEAGYRHIDTAAIYGNEQGVGQAVAQSGIPRSEIFITTKLWCDDVRSGEVRKALESSLEKLGTDYVDLYLIHWPADNYTDAWQKMVALRQEGLIKSVGVSNFEPHHLQTLRQHSDVIPAINQIEAHPYLTNDAVIAFCKEQGIVPEVWSPLGRGAEFKDPVIKAIADKYQKTVAQVIIRWHLQRGTVVIPKSVHQDRIISNADVFGFKLSEEEMTQISALNKDLRVGSHPDHFNF